VCSLHQIELARTHFPRIIGLRDGRVMFDAKREAVTDAMIAALYRNAAGEEEPAFEMVSPPAKLATGPRCF
jgi:phosphonate transport system ATP-binding protein